MDYSCNLTAYFKPAEADLTIKALRRMLRAGQGDLPPSLTVVDDYTVHKLDSFKAGLESINSTRVLVKPGLTSLQNPGDRLINKIIKAKTKSKYIAWSMRQTADEHGKLPLPSRAQSATWAAEACEQIPRRTIVRSFVACRVTRPEDYSLEERSAFGLNELLHNGFKRAMAAILDDDGELRAQLETMSDAGDDEWLHDERTTHVEENHEEPGEAQPQEGMGESPTSPQRKGAAAAVATAAAVAPRPPVATATAAAAEEEKEEDWTELEVGSDELAEDHLPFAGLVGSDVCVLPLAFPGEELKMPGAIGWRGEVTGKRGGGRSVQVRVFGAWLELYDARRICAIEQVESGQEEGEEEGEEEEGEEEEGEEEEGEEEEGEESTELDSSGDERPPKKKKA
jgi:hypothetical protein